MDCQNKGIIVSVCCKKCNGDIDTDHYFDKLLYKERYSDERTNVCIDSLSSLLDLFNRKVSSWKGFNFLSFNVIVLKKFNKPKKP